MTDASEQLKLKLPRKPVVVDQEMVVRCPSMTRAIVLCAEMAALENDKDQARAIDIDPTSWSLIRDGKRAFPQDRYLEMFDQFGNELPLLYLLYQRGYDLNSLRKRETETERALRTEREAHSKTRERLEYLEELHTGKLR